MTKIARQLSPRAKFIQTVDLKKLAGYAWDAMQLASTHDPDLVKVLNGLIKSGELSVKAHQELDHKLESWVKQLWREVDALKRRADILDRQMERLGAPQYRVVHKGKPRK